MRITKYFSVAIILFSIALVSCGPSRQERRDEIEKSMKSWVGKSETELVAKLGPPSNTYKLTDGSRELTYRSFHHSYGWYGPYPYKTERGFTIDPNGTIVAYRWDGF